MPIEIKMPALSPTMEEGTLAKWHVKVGDTVAAGDILAEIETDKATMEFEAVDEGTIASLPVAEGSEGVKVGTVIATMSGDGEAAAPAVKAEAAAPPATKATEAPKAEASTAKPAQPASAPAAKTGKRVNASPLARRIAAERGIDLSTLTGTGPHGRIVRADLDGAPAAASAPVAVASAPAASAPFVADDRVPHTVEKLSSMRKTIARRLTQSMVEAPHIYLTVDVRLGALLNLRAELNEALAAQNVKVSVNDLLVKALGRALIQVPECNVSFAGDQLIRYQRADISVAVSIPGGLITPIVTDANGRSISSIATAMKDLGARAREGKLQPAEYQGGTASLSNMGMMGIKQFTAVINPPQAMILAVGAGEKRPVVQPDGSLGVADVMTVTGSFDHRAVDGADGARLMDAFRALVEKPLALLA